MKPSLKENSPYRRENDRGALRDALNSSSASARSDRRAVEPTTGQRLIRLREVLSICGKSRSSIYESIKRGEFPSPVKLGGRSSAWVQSEVLEWVAERIRDSRT